MNFHRHRRGWLSPNQHRHRSVLSGLSGLGFLKKVKTAHHVCRAASHINARSFDPVIWSRVNAAGACERTASPVDSDSESATPPAFPRAASASPLPNDSTAGTAWDSLGTVLSETVVTVSLSAPLGPVQWAISTFQDSRNDLDLEAVTSTCFGLTTIALTSWHRPIFATATGCWALGRHLRSRFKSHLFQVCSKAFTDRMEPSAVSNYCSLHSMSEMRGWVRVNAGDHSILGFRRPSICLSVNASRQYVVPGIIMDSNPGEALNTKQ